MADPKAENALREAVASLEKPETRCSPARDYLKIDASRARHAALSIEAEDPNLWSDQDHAREVTTELGRLTNDLDTFDGLRRGIDDCAVLIDFSREALASGDADWSLLDELTENVTRVTRELAALEIQSIDRKST